MIETIFTGLGYALFMFVVIVIIWLPVINAKQRKLSKDKINTIRLLTLIGIFIGITWIVALILSCTYQKDEVVVASYPVKQKNVNFDVNQVMEEGEVCKNCGNTIGKLDTPMIWNGQHVVCRKCYKMLSNG